jgi:hypothetical protein
VVKHAEVLADSYNADKEVVIIAAWRHNLPQLDGWQILYYPLQKKHYV